MDSGPIQRSTVKTTVRRQEKVDKNAYQAGVRADRDNAV
jgi:hypothetical protein